MWIMYQNEPTPQEKLDIANREKQAAVQATKASVASPISASTTGEIVTTSFGTGTEQAVANNGSTVLENELVILTIANKGGYIIDAKLKKFEKTKKGSGELVSIIKDNNASLSLKLSLKDGRVLDTKNVFFEPTVLKNSTGTILKMKFKATETSFLEYQYTLKPADYMVGFDVTSANLDAVLNTSKPADLEWSMKTFRNEKSISYENRYTEMYFGHEAGKADYLGQSHDDTETPTAVDYVAFKQHFFTSILLTDKPFASSTLYSTNLVNDEKKDTIFTKQFRANLPLTFTNGALSHKMHWFYGPSDYKTLNAYDKNLEKTVALGWGIFGWINRHVFIPTFDFISGFMGIGLAIIIFTVLVKLLMSPVTYKSFLSQAKMKVLRPDIAELGEKFKKDPMKKQQETMKLYNKAGVNPMAGCIPALIQMPVFYALFQFFPAAIALRHQNFLWADDLSSYDAVFKLPFTIPGYGNHVSLFPILASIAIFFYMKMTTGDQQMQAPQQEGMPDMGKIMKIMIYVSPLMMLFFFNNYAAGLSL